MKIICNADGYPVQRRRIAEGIEFLRNRVTGSPSLGPIDFERYPNYRIDLNSYGQIADGAQMILDQCSPGDKYVSGEVVFTTSDDPEGAWAVFVSLAHC
ncbi:hypothetical protein SMAC4_13309 [Sordaria macrospora]|uniref:uncharacterized protein n=1 Tax=Sordaria macrospora TaxID=5147 RepID=UPI002B2D447E|nr:hypothetical protein SMAC4_13309 [Sordaria macrospora]